MNIFGVTRQFGFYIFRETCQRARFPLSKPTNILTGFRGGRNQHEFAQWRVDDSFAEFIAPYPFLIPWRQTASRYREVRKSILHVVLADVVQSRTNGVFHAGSFIVLAEPF